MMDVDPVGGSCSKQLSPPFFSNKRTTTINEGKSGKEGCFKKGTDNFLPSFLSTISLNLVTNRNWTRMNRYIQTLKQSIGKSDSLASVISWPGPPYFLGQGPWPAKDFVCIFYGRQRPLLVVS
jgi:hypothetical protein